MSLTDADAEIIKAMLKRGDKQQDIAAYFGVNSARISEIVTGDKFSWVQASSEAGLPPAGPPSLTGKKTHELLIALEQANEATLKAMALIKSY